MKKFILFLLLIPVFISRCNAPGEKPEPVKAPVTANKELVQISINYPLHDGVFMWGIIGQIFERTNILELNGIKGEIQPLKDSIETTVACLNHKSDISLNSTGGVSLMIAMAQAKQLPAVRLIAVLGAGGRNALIVPYDSPIQDVKDLKGKKILNPIMGALLDRFIEPGGLTRADIIMTEKYDYGLDTIKAFQTGGFDAAMSWDPFVQEHVEKQEARILAHDPYHLEIIVRQELIDKNTEAVINFLIALKEAIFFIQQNEGMVIKWYCDATGLDVGLIKRCMIYADIYNETKDIKSINEISLIPADNKIIDMQNVADAMVWSGTFKARGLPSDKINIKDSIDLNIIRKSEEKASKKENEFRQKVTVLK